MECEARFALTENLQLQLSQGKIRWSPIKQIHTIIHSHRGSRMNACTADADVVITLQIETAAALALGQTFELQSYPPLPLALQQRTAQCWTRRLSMLM